MPSENPSDPSDLRTGDVQLTPRQLEVLKVMAKGLTNREIGDVLGISSGTVRVHVTAILEALGVSNRTEATNAYHEMGISGEGGGAHGMLGAATVTGRPALAVLPLTPFSDESDAAHLADGISEDLITRLARWNWFPVVSRNSSFAFRGRAVDAIEISRDLGAGFLVEGSVRTAGAQVRITVQLIDGQSGQHLWAKHYDRDSGHLLDVQDEIVDTIVATLEPSLLQIGGLRIVEGDSKSRDAWDRVQAAYVYLARNDGPSLERAALLAEESIALDPRLAPAYGAAFYANFLLNLLSRSADSTPPVEKLETLSRQLEELEPLEPFAPVGRSMALLARKKKREALEAVERAIELAPRMIYPLWVRALALSSADRPQDSVEAHHDLLRLAPEDPLKATIRTTYGIALLMSGRTDESIEQFKASTKEAPGLPYSRSMLAGVYHLLEQEDEMHRLFDEIREVEPGYDPRVPADIMIPDFARASTTTMLQKGGWPARLGDPVEGDVLG